MANQNPSRDNSAQSTDQDQNQAAQDRQNASDRPSTAANRPDESISTVGDTALGKGSKTDIRKEEKEQSYNYDTSVS